MHDGAGRRPGHISAAQGVENLKSIPGIAIKEAAMANAGVVNAGLDGIVVAETRLSHIDGEKGELIYGGYDIDDLARNTTFEEVCYLLWNGELPNREQLEGLKGELQANAGLTDQMLAVLRAIPGDADPMAALRTAVSALGTFDKDADDISDASVRRKAIYLTAVTPALVAAFDRLRNGKEPLQPREGKSVASNFL